tara:strand:- start:232 stop:483 length:252 start_codon:yes stop_codon:yes gene_type:complete
MAVFSEKQGQYLAFIYAYTEINGVPPAEADLRRYFQTSAPTVHSMIKRLDTLGLISRVPGQARTLVIQVDPNDLPLLRRPRQN